MSGISADSHCNKESVISDQLHGIVGEIEGRNKANVATFDVEIATIGHGDVELANSKDHSVESIVALGVADGLKPSISAT